MFDLQSGHGRRHFLRVGALGLAGLGLPDVLRARSEAKGRGVPANDTAVIQVYLAGGPSHLDTYDPKPDAPREFRGEFDAAATRVPGVRVGELLTRQARVMDRLALVRGLHHTASDHSAGSHWVLTGLAPNEPNPRGNDRPSVGSVVARVRGSNGPGLPPYVAIPRTPAFAYAGDLGAGYNPFGCDAESGGRHLEPPPGHTLARVDDRRGLLRALDNVDRRRDLSGTMAGMDRFTAEAFAMITGPAARAAFDLSRESPAVRARYGETPVGRNCLLARRLVEAGVTFVTVNEGGWDHHSGVFDACRKQIPPLDAAVAALVEDLHDRGLDRRVLVVVWGEFGRTPRVNGRSGRDHWPGAFTAVLAGGGLKTGLAVGATTRQGESPAERPTRPEDVVRTVYAVLGVDPLREFAGAAGRPTAVLNQGAPIAELF